MSKNQAHPEKEPSTDSGEYEIVPNSPTAELAQLKAKTKDDDARLAELADEVAAQKAEILAKKAEILAKNAEIALLKKRLKDQAGEVDSSWGFESDLK